MCGGQEEQDLVQGLQTEEVSDGGDVQVWLQVRAEVQLVQDPLSDAEKCNQEAVSQRHQTLSTV